MAPKLQDSKEAGYLAARAIMTTDTHEKEAAVTFEAGGRTVTVGGMCKGSGMIHPNMCTMLSFITTDLAISKELLWEALKKDVEDTYNMVSVDGDTSTNDTVLLLANGAAENPVITEKNADYEAFCRALNFVNTALAKEISIQPSINCVAWLLVGHGCRSTMKRSNLNKVYSLRRKGAPEV